MKIAIENHRYAPELNKVYIKGKQNSHWLPYKINRNILGGNITSIKEARKELFYPIKAGLFFTITKKYPCGILPDETVRGYGTNKDALRMKRQLMAKSGAGRVLYNGSIMPTPIVIIKAELIG